LAVYESFVALTTFRILSSLIGQRLLGWTAVVTPDGAATVPRGNWD